MKKLPIGIQSFLKLRENKEYRYVDKTKYVKMLLEDDADYFFLSRPRRFGKSLDTLRQAFFVKGELFEGMH